MALAPPEDDDAEDGSFSPIPFGTPLADLLRSSSSSFHSTSWEMVPDDVSYFQPCNSPRNEPASPHITCLGQVRVTYPHLQMSPMSCTHRAAPPSSSSTPQTLFRPANLRFQKRNLIRGKQIPHRIIQVRQNCCLRFSFTPTVGNRDQKEPKEVEITRRERLAILLHDLRIALETDSNAEQLYVPSVPPPNSLLLMRGFRRPACAYAQSDFGGNENIIPASTDNSGISKTVSSLCDGKGGEQATTPFSNMTNASSPGAPPISAPKAALWERRSIPQLAHIDVKRNVV